PELQGRVILTGFVADEDLASLYSNSIMFIYVSIYEGFGLPILEAMKCGCAVISSNTSSMPEVGGDSVAYTNPADINEISNIIERLATDEIYRNELAMRALKRSGEFNWQKTAARIIEEITC
ncbi:MAG TPA: glycosyltransferase family 1 protein, partial [Alphaproteobacteria bacterium]|nr:glycosyltransferase family 1 protein [Alphaproteobacteria bacterium]